MSTEKKEEDAAVSPAAAEEAEKAPAATKPDEEKIIMNPLNFAKKTFKDATTNVTNVMKDPKSLMMMPGKKEEEEKTPAEERPLAESTTKKSESSKKPNITTTSAEFMEKIGQGPKNMVRRLTGVSKDDEQKKSSTDAGGGSSLPPDDEQLASMDLIISKTIKGTTVQEWYETCWSEGCRTDKEPFYGPWLEKDGKQDVKVEDWIFADDDNDDDKENFVGAWDKEQYQQKRTVTFHFSGGGFSSGETHVKHTQYCRISKDRCILSMTVEMQGIPFADCFNVQIRWVAASLGGGDDLVSLRVGLFVVFIKKTIVAGQIRSGTTSKTTAAQLDLYANMVTACGATEHHDDDAGLLQLDEDDKTQTKDASGGGGVAALLFRNVLQAIFDALVFVLATFLGAVLAHPALHDKAVDIVAAGMVKVMNDDKLHEHVAAVSAAVQKAQAIEAAQQQGKNFYSDFMSGMWKKEQQSERSSTGSTS